MSLRALVQCGVLAVVLTGCTVADYEARMLQTQLRQQRLDEYAKLLGQPLQLPPREDKKGPIAKIYLRPPLAINNMPSNSGDPRVRLFYTYPAQKVNPPPAISAVELAIGEPGKDFAKEVMTAFTPTAEPKRTTRTLTVPGRDKPLQFQTIDFGDGQFYYSINLCRSDKAQVAIVYRGPLSQRGSAERVITLSLETFAFGNEADIMAQTMQGIPLMPPQHPPRQS